MRAEHLERNQYTFTPMFDFKNKKGGRAATTTLPSTANTSDATLRSPLERVFKIGKAIKYSLSTTLGRKTSEEPSLTNQSNSPIRLPSDTPTATTGSSHTSEACDTDPNSPSSSKSTAATERSLPRLSCGENFFVPGISLSPELRSDPERSPIQKQDSLSVHSPVLIACEVPINTVIQTEGEISAKPKQLPVKKEKTLRFPGCLKAFWKKIAFTQHRASRPSNSDSNKPKHNDAAIDSGTFPGANKDKYCQSANTNKDVSDEGDGPRCDFKTIEAIPDAKYRELIKACDLSSSPTTTVEVVRRAKGTFNAATFVTVCEGEQTRKYVVRVPGHGTRAHWQEEDSYVLKNEAQLIEYIRKNTNAPVAQVIDYSTGHDNALGFPYILMTMLPGTPANNIWFPEDYPSVDNDLFQHADVPPPHIEKKRLKFLRSLARAMIELQTLKFEAIGAPNFDDDGNFIGIGPTCHCTYEDGDEVFKRPPAATTEEYIRARFGAKIRQMMADNRERLLNDTWEEDDGREERGVRDILYFIFYHQSVFRGQPGETFTLHHDDLDLQNILCDDEGNVTGIIDWDNAMAAPRCIGATAVPMFLRSDWFPEYTFGLDKSPYMAWNHEHYREIYAAAIAEASDAENAEFTLKSGLYQAAVAAVTQGGYAEGLIDKLLREIPHCRLNYWTFIRGLGRGGWVSAENMLKTQFARIFEPVMPPEGLLEALDQELEMQTTWWSCCDELLDLYEAEKGVKEEEEEEEDAEEFPHNTAVVSD
ncbi:uncharacterized protein J4E84_008005 [Alternaria hordeiaustralica]|uniref:uncharacterized protein n=1 Tax=Alternaria hordeiaustralica TaxID=1187925 RepID=UPI0020C33989|nr:uncharacterized protein J4E84_008005 [Alternaria hordeiaustralica]KAI4680357.1 hypothetical protein J4E84_008005 [Alternaria hordeiaustralica]